MHEQKIKLYTLGLVFDFKVPQNVMLAYLGCVTC